MNNLPVKYTHFYGESNVEKMPHKQNNRCFPFIVAVHVNSGQYICEYSSKKLIVESGETLIVPEYILHHIRMEYNGFLSWSHFSAHLENNDILCNYEVPFIVSKEFSGHIKECIDTINHSEVSCFGTLIRDHYISKLLIVILTNYDSIVGSQDKAWIIDLKKYITKNITKKFTLDDLSAYCHMSASSFSHKFRNDIGVSPMKYIIRQKINASLNLLESGETLAAISQKLNFANEYYYSKQFKAITGMTPSDYRKNTIIP